MGNILLTEKITLIKIREMLINKTGVYIYDYFHSKPFFIDKNIIDFYKVTYGLEINQVLEIRYNTRNNHIIDVINRYDYFYKEDRIQYPIFYQRIPNHETELN